jgi:hypothetical protein
MSQGSQSTGGNNERIKERMGRLVAGVCEQLEVRALTMAEGRKVLVRSWSGNTGNHKSIS